MIIDNITGRMQFFTKIRLQKISEEKADEGSPYDRRRGRSGGSSGCRAAMTKLRVELIGAGWLKQNRAESAQDQTATHVTKLAS